MEFIAVVVLCLLAFVLLPKKPDNEQIETAEVESHIPEDSMLRRHYLANLKAQAESKNNSM